MGIVKAPGIVMHCASLSKLNTMTSFEDSWCLAREDQLTILVTEALIQFKQQRQNAYAFSCLFGENKLPSIGLVFAQSLRTAQNQLSAFERKYEVDAVRLPVRTRFSDTILCLEPGHDKAYLIDLLRTLTFDMPLCANIYSVEQSLVR